MTMVWENREPEKLKRWNRRERTREWITPAQFLFLGKWRSWIISSVAITTIIVSRLDRELLRCLSCFGTSGAPNANFHESPFEYTSLKPLRTASSRVRQTIPLVSSIKSLLSIFLPYMCHLVHVLGIRTCSPKHADKCNPACSTSHSLIWRRHSGGTIIPEAPPVDSWCFTKLCCEGESISTCPPLSK